MKTRRPLFTVPNTFTGSLGLLPGFLATSRNGTLPEMQRAIAATMYVHIVSRSPMLSDEKRAEMLAQVSVGAHATIHPQHSTSVN
jgi:hypothetical protein